MKRVGTWVAVCNFDELLPDSGVAALIEEPAVTAAASFRRRPEKQVAIFRVRDLVYALDNYDPQSDANVLSRGLVGDVRGEPVVASPIYKQHFSLITGRCLEDPEHSVRAYPVRVADGRIWIKPEALRAARRRKLVVIGNGMAGMKVVEQLLEIAPSAYDITVFGAEPHPNYNRILLSPLLAGEKRFEDIILHPLEWYRDKGVTLHTSDPIVSIDRVRRVARAASGAGAPYDRLLLATGSKPIVLPIPGNDLQGVVTFRDVADVGAMLQAARKEARAVVIGGGLLGLEAAYGLSKQGMQVTVVHLLDTLMERQLDRVAARLLQESLESRGLAFRMGAKTVALLANPDSRERVGAVQLEDGRELDAELVVMAIGIRPNIELARASGLRCDRGVLVNDTMQTYDPSIYAVGECVQHRNHTYGLVAPLFEQANVCATHLAEFGIGCYAGSVVATHLKVTGIDVFSAGDFAGSAGNDILTMKDARRGIYKRIVLDNGRVRGAVLYGDVSDGPWYLELMAQGRDVTGMRDTLLFGPLVDSDAAALRAAAIRSA